MYNKLTWSTVKNIPAPSLMCLLLCCLLYEHVRSDDYAENQVVFVSTLHCVVQIAICQGAVMDWRTKLLNPKPCARQDYQSLVAPVYRGSTVVFDDQKLSYKDLNKKSNQLARLIRDKYKKQNITLGILINNWKIISTQYGINKSKWN